MAKAPAPAPTRKLPSSARAELLKLCADKSSLDRGLVIEHYNSLQYVFLNYRASEDARKPGMRDNAVVAIAKLLSMVEAGIPLALDDKGRIEGSSMSILNDAGEPRVSFVSAFHALVSQTQMPHRNVTSAFVLLLKAYADRGYFGLPPSASQDAEPFHPSLLTEAMMASNGVLALSLIAAGADTTRVPHVDCWVSQSHSGGEKVRIAAGDFPALVDMRFRWSWEKELLIEAHRQCEAAAMMRKIDQAQAGMGGEGRAASSFEAQSIRPTARRAHL